MRSLMVLLVIQFLCLQAIAQNTLNGTVYSGEDNSPLAGATVISKNGHSNAITNGEGKFTLDNISTGDVIVVSFIGFETKEVTVSGFNALNITLNPSGLQLNNVVVTALGINKEERALGYSVGNVTSDEINQVPQQNVLQGLSGKVSGLSISNVASGISGNPVVMIRGNESLSGDNTPLIVVNGVPTGTDTRVLANLSADNIESVTILKGPSAAALYGSRAGAGVILVTTKTGEGAKGLGVDLNLSYSAIVPYRMINLQQDFIGGNNGLFDPSSDQQRWGPPMGAEIVLPNTDGQPHPSQPHPNNLKDFFNIGGIYNNDVRIYGGGDKTTFNLSISDKRAKDYYPGSKLHEDAIGLTATHKITDHFKVTADINLLVAGSNNYRIMQRGPADGDRAFEDLQYWPNYIDINDYRDYWSIKNVQQNTPTARINNPFFVAMENKHTFKRFRNFGNIRFDWDINDHFSLMGRVSNFGESYTPTYQDGKSDLHIPLGSYSYITSYRRELNTDFLLGYNKKTQNFELDVKGGGNMRFENSNGAGMFGTNLIVPGVFTSSNIDRNTVDYSSFFSKKRVYSLYGVADLSYKRMIYLDLTARNDWSSTLPPDNRSYFYPSASVSLILSQMLSLPQAISLLKLRGGWAKVGKDTDPYQLQQALVSNNWGSHVGYRLPDNMANSRLEPEEILSYEAGLDASFFRDRINLDFTYYQITDKNQIMNVSLPTLSGFRGAGVNAGVIRNRGVEIGLNGDIIRSGKVNWNTRFSFTKNKSKLLELPAGLDVFQFWESDQNANMAVLNEDIGDLWGTDVVRVNEGPYAGWPLLTDNGAVQRDTKKTKYGNVYPDFTLGFQSTLTIGRFQIFASLDWRNGGNFYSKGEKRLIRGGRSKDWGKGNTYTGILSNNSFNGDNSALANEIKNNPGKYQGQDRGLTYVGGRTTELGGFPSPVATSTLDNGIFFPGVRSDGNGGYIENFGGPDTKYLPIDMIADPGQGYWTQGTQTWIYSASYLNLREFAIDYKLSNRVAKLLHAQNVSVSIFLKDLMVWTAAGIDFNPELMFNPSGEGLKQDDTYQVGREEALDIPWTLSTGLRLSIKF